MNGPDGYTVVISVGRESGNKKDEVNHNSINKRYAEQVAEMNVEIIYFALDEENKKRELDIQDVNDGIGLTGGDLKITGGNITARYEGIYLSQNKNEINTNFYENEIVSRNVEDVKELHFARKLKENLRFVHSYFL